MNTQQLIDTARALVADDKGLLAMDEMLKTMKPEVPRQEQET